MKDENNVSHNLMEVRSCKGEMAIALITMAPQWYDLGKKVLHDLKDKKEQR